MNTRSLRFRLIIWYFVAFFLSAALVFGSFYYLTRQILLQQTDREIALHSHSIVEILASQENDSHLSVPAGQISQEFAQMPGMLVAVSDPAGNGITTSQAVGSGLPVVQETLRQSAHITRPVYVNRTIGTIFMRAGIFPVTRNNTPVGLVMVAHPLDVISGSLNL